MGFDNVLTSLGINGMKVFIRLNQREYDLSDTISGCVHLKAGQIDEAFTIDVGEDKKIDFSFKPESLTFKSLKSHIYLHTHVYIGHGLDEEMEAVIPYRR